MIGNRIKVSRRSFVKLAGAAVFGGAGGLMYCAVEPYWLQEKRRLVQVKNLWSGNLRIMHVSDLHIGNRQQFEFIKRALIRGLEHQPDLICMTGDFINRRQFNPRGCGALFRKLVDCAPVFACLGNHDGGKWAGRVGGYPDPSPVDDLLSESGVAVLRNRNVALSLQGRPVTLIGLDDKWSGTMNVEKAFAGLSSGTLRIVLSHNPDMKTDLKDQRWDLMLSGHTHGGQLYIPGVGAPVLPVEDRRFIHGLYSWNNRQLHISSGVGTACGVRFNCPPEICQLELKGAV